MGNCKECGKELPKRKTKRSGRVREFCGEKCQYRNWVKRHPRVAVEAK